MKIITFIALCSTLVLTSNVNASTYVDTSKKNETGAFSIEALWGRSEFQYAESTPSSSKNDTNRIIQRSLIGASITYGAHELVDTYISYGLITNYGLYRNTSSGELIEGGGSIYTFGAKGYIPIDIGFDLTAYGEYTFWNEDLADTSNTTITQEGSELLVGTTASTEIDSFIVYTGLEVVLTSNIEGKIKSGANSQKLDIERSNIFGLHAGVRYEFDNYVVRLDTTILKNPSNTISIGMSF